MISHADVREALELAAIEPGGLDRLMAGDTPDAVLVASHLAGCDLCTAEFTRLSRSAAVLRDTIGMEAPPELRERTLAFVRAVGRPRGPAVAAASAAGAVAPGEAVATAAAFGALDSAPAPANDGIAAASAVPAVAAAGPHPATPAGTPPRSFGDRVRGALRPGSPFLTWGVATAALVLIAVALTAGITLGGRDGDDQPRTTDAAALAQVAEWSIRIAAQPDASRVVLTSTTSPASLGTLQFSPSSREVVVVADGLTQPTAGQGYGCWVMIDGKRQKLGPMFFTATNLAYWVGDVDLLANVPAGATFGVSLVDSSGTLVAPDPVLQGTL